MRVEEIHWHDSVVLGVEIRPESDTLLLRLSYPVNWETNTYENRVVLFTGAYGYKEFEEPFVGAPTILSAAVIADNEQWKLLRLETNAGHRELFFKELALVES